MRPPRIFIPLALAAMLLVAPATTLAQGAGEPEMMEDPVEAMEPEIAVEPVRAAAGDDVAAQGGAMPEAQGNVEEAVANDVHAADPAGAVAPLTPVASGAGQLPFTGLDSGQLIQMLLIGSVLLAGGVTSMAWARARTETA